MEGYLYACVYLKTCIIHCTGNTTAHVFNWNNGRHTVQVLSCSTSNVQPCSISSLWLRDYWDSLIHAAGKLICTYSISTHHWGSGVYIELQMTYVWLAWGAGNTQTAFGYGVVLSGKNDHSPPVPYYCCLFAVRLPGFYPFFPHLHSTHL